MSVAASPSDDVGAAKPSLGALRTTAGVALAVARGHDGHTRLAHLEEYGGVRAKFPRSEHGCEAVTINTGGGMLGGDRYAFSVSAHADASVRVASQSAERIYRALAEPTTVQIAIQGGPGAAIAWLPQETILYDGARLSRRIEVDMSPTATLLLVEATVFGRAAHGESVHSGTLHDRWRIWRGGHLVYADDVRLRGDMHDALAQAAIGAGARAAATVLCISSDAEDRRDAARDALGTPQGRAAISAWNGMLVGRFLAPDSATLRADLIRVVSHLARAPMPRVWNC